MTRPKPPSLANAFETAPKPGLQVRKDLFAARNYPCETKKPRPLQEFLRDVGVKKGMPSEQFHEFKGEQSDTP